MHADYDFEEAWSPGPGPWHDYIFMHQKLMTSTKLSRSEEDRMLEEMALIWARISGKTKEWLGREILGSRWAKETMQGVIPPLDSSIWDRIHAR